MRKGSAVKRFSDGLVIQGESAGVLRLTAYRTVSAHVSPDAFGLLRPLAAACTSEGIRRDTGIISWLHWPDLVTIDGRVVAKASLSQAESPWSDGSLRATFDISVNCFAKSDSAFASELPATSILEALGVEIDLDLLRDKILHALDWYYAEWERGMHRKLVERMEPTIAWLGRDIEVTTTDGRALKGFAKGLDDDGSLLLEQHGETRKRITRAIRSESVKLVRVAH